VKRTRTNFLKPGQGRFAGIALKGLPSFLLVFLFSTASNSQTLPVGTPLVEDLWRRLQISGEKDINVSFNIRPLHSGIDNFDSLYLPLQDSLQQRRPSRGIFTRGKNSLRLLPVTFSQQYTTAHPYGWNDGPVIGARGYEGYLRMGLFGRVGPLSFQFQPELVYAQNKAFPLFPSAHNDSIWRSYSYVANRIDAPDQFGNKRYFRAFPGQSSIRLNFKKLSFGVSTENLWWGPGIRNALIMSNNAPGFAHLTFNTTAPVITGIGSFEWQVIAGKLKNSNFISFDTTRTFDGKPLYLPKLNDNRYINAMVVSWQPRWTKGLHLGIQRVFYQYNSHRSASLDGYLPVFSRLFKKNTVDEGIYGRDQLLSVFLRMIMPQSKAEFYAEYGRNDHSQDLIDLVLEPEHARAYILGARKIFDITAQQNIETFFEITHLQNPPTANIRALEGWYTHYQVRHGYTHMGQVIGAGVGTGGNSQASGFNWIKGYRKMGLMFERIVHNNDFYYDAFRERKDFGSHWVDLSMNLNKQWMKKRIIYNANLTLIRALNYQWQHDMDRNNVFLQFSTSYVF
jgi:hypothetical protein